MIQKIPMEYFSSGILHRATICLGPQKMRFSLSIPRNIFLKFQKFGKFSVNFGNFPWKFMNHKFPEIYECSARRGAEIKGVTKETGGKGRQRQRSSARSRGGEPWCIRRAAKALRWDQAPQGKGPTRGRPGGSSPLSPLSPLSPEGPAASSNFEAAANTEELRAAAGAPRWSTPPRG